MTDECPICEEGLLTEHQETNQCVVLDAIVKVPMKYSVCNSCGSEQAYPEQLAWNKKQLSLVRLREVLSRYQPDHIRIELNLMTQTSDGKLEA